MLTRRFPVICALGAVIASGALAQTPAVPLARLAARAAGLPGPAAGMIGLYEDGTRLAQSLPALVPRERWGRIAAVIAGMAGPDVDGMRLLQPLSVNGREPTPLAEALTGSVLSQLPADHKLLLYQRIDAPRGGVRTIRVLTPNAAKVYLNGRQIWAQQTADLLAPPESITLKLETGVNHLVTEADPTPGFCFLTTRAAQRVGTFLAPLLAANPVALAWFEPWLEAPVEGNAPDALDACLTATGQKILAELRQRGGTPDETLARAGHQLSPGIAIGEKARMVVQTAALRRTLRLKELGAKAPAMVFASHRDYRPSFFAYVESLSDARAERHFLPGSALARIDFSGPEPVVRELLRDDHGMIRDPDVSYDGRRVLFAWKQSDRNDDFQLHEMDLATGSLRQVTYGLGIANYEGAYLPDNTIVFSSTRNEHSVPCWTTEVSNLYKINTDGSFLRRLAVDQVHSIYPKPTDDGRITYTRWDYNDRGQVFPQPLFQMNQDGTMQGGLYGASSWFPTSLLHARQVPGTQKFLSIAAGHHTPQAGKVVVADTAQGRDEGEGLEFIAPRIKTHYERVDAAMQRGSQFSHPYPLGNDSFVSAHMPAGRAVRRFDLYWFDYDGGRELLVPATGLVSHLYPVALSPRPTGHVRPDAVAYARNDSVTFIEDVYQGGGLAGIPRGAAARLRVVEIRYRSATIGSVGNQGEGGGASNGTPVAIAQGSWDIKAIIGETPIHPDGSVMVKVPAMKSLYYQVLDAQGQVIQTMRSWDTNRPGEIKACIGCHSYARNAAPASPDQPAIASRSAPAELEPFAATGWTGFSFARHIQPILDRSCVRCHAGPAHKNGIDLRGNEFATDGRAQRTWSRAYLDLTASTQRKDGSFSGNPDGPQVKWINKMSKPSILEPYSAGAAKSPLIALLRKGHHEVKLSDAELRTLCAWIDLVVPYCGDYHEGAVWNDGESKYYRYYEDKRLVHKQEESAELQRHNEGVRADSWYVADTPDLEIELARAGTNVLTRKIAARDLSHGAELDLPGPLRVGDRLTIRGARHLRLGLGLGALPDAEIFTPDRNFSWTVEPAANRVYPPELFAAAKLPLRVKPLRAAERSAYRNLARNPLAPAVSNNSVFPSATASSETRGEGVFAARAAIDGFEANGAHGGFPNQSWGPEQAERPWLAVNFGRPVRIDRVDLLLRADFPHDESWKHAKLFADGREIKSFELRHEAGVQTIQFPPVACAKLELRDLEWRARGWCALTELRVWGLDADRTPQAIIDQQSAAGTLKDTELQ